MPAGDYPVLGIITHEMSNSILHSHDLIANKIGKQILIMIMTIINEYVPLNISSPITSPIAIQKQVIPVNFPLWFLFHPGLGGRSHHAATTGRRCREARSLRQFKTLGMVWVCPWLWGDNMRTIGISCMTMTYWENFGKRSPTRKCEDEGPHQMIFVRWYHGMQ